MSGRKGVRLTDVTGTGEEPIWFREIFPTVPTEHGTGNLAFWARPSRVSNVTQARSHGRSRTSAARGAATAKTSSERTDRKDDP